MTQKNPIKVVYVVVFVLSDDYQLSNTTEKRKQSLLVLLVFFTLWYYFCTIYCCNGRRYVNKEISNTISSLFIKKIWNTRIELKKFSLFFPPYSG